ncbi:unnamed protein product [Thlaspi arvense]|uniref:APO domain-containing protein n=1 Tax=Thlaspi arvense TaxID=13288 RepID=A0AAU9S0H9_THLAR|nr:unnamed protein product [Thlaspi arvense]
MRVRDVAAQEMRRGGACGYCSEVHAGPWGHSVKLCGEFKHQWRDGKHGWQDALVDEIFPPNYVWHVRDLKEHPPSGSLKSGARVPQCYKAMMRIKYWKVEKLKEKRDVASSSSTSRRNQASMASMRSLPMENGSYREESQVLKYNSTKMITKSTALDSKRIIPTGPNPLHNSIYLLV